MQLSFFYLPFIRLEKALFFKLAISWFFTSKSVRTTLTSRQSVPPYLTQGRLYAGAIKNIFFLRSALFLQANRLGKKMQIKQTEPKGYPKAYNSTSRVKFVWSKKNNQMENLFKIFYIDNPYITPKCATLPYTGKALCGSHQKLLLFAFCAFFTSD